MGGWERVGGGRVGLVMAVDCGGGGRVGLVVGWIWKKFSYFRILIF